MLDIPTSSSTLFAGIAQDEANLMLPCLGARRRAFGREERIMRAGQPTEYLGIVLSGRVRIEVSDAWGETTILDILGPGSLFAHGYACSMEPLDIDVLADSACEVVLLKAERIIHPCPKQCGCHSHISSNLMRALALSNLDMNRRAIAMTPKTIRGKILAFLSQQQKKAGARLRHPLQPNQAGKLPQRRPQRVVERAVEAAQGRRHRLRRPHIPAPVARRQLADTLQLTRISALRPTRILALTC